MPIEIDVAHVARLARLELDDEELEHYGAQLGVILDHAAQVQSIETGDVPPTAHPLALTNAFRDDAVKPSLDRDAVMSQAPDAQEGLFRVPPSLDLP